MSEAFTNIVTWVNAPIFHIGQTPVTFGGIGIAILIFVGSLFVSSVVQRVMSIHLKSTGKFTSAMIYAFQKIVHYIIVFLGVLIAAQCIGLNFGSLAVAFGFLGVGVGLGLQSLTANFVSGLILLLERPVGAGDFINVEGQIGKIIRISMRSTIIRTQDNIYIIVPNSTLVDSPVTNWSFEDERVRVHCPVGVAYGSDVPKVKETLLKVAEDHPEVLDKPAPDVRFLEFGDSSLNFDLLVWIDHPEKQFFIQSQINYAIDDAFRANGITIPFPQRDLHVQMNEAVETLSGVKGRM